MQITALIGISTETQPLFQVFKDGILIGTLNAENKNSAREQCASKYDVAIDWQELKAQEILRS